MSALLPIPPANAGDRQASVPNTRHCPAVLTSAGYAFGVAVLTAAISRAAVGPCFNLLLVMMFASALIAAPLAAGNTRQSAGLAPLTGMWVGMSGALVLSFRPSLSDGQLTQCTVLVAAVVVAVGGTARLLASVGFSPVFAAATATVTVAAWLAWPAWLTTAPPLAIAIHPLLALNGAVAGQLGVWTEQPIAYRITVLGQDVPYALSKSVLACAVAHGSWGVAAGLSAGLIRRHRRGHRTAGD